MSVTEKIENAKKRINELEELIHYWDKSKTVAEKVTSVNENKIESLVV